MHNNDKMLYYVTFDPKNNLTLLILLPILLKTIYHVTVLKFSTNTKAKTIKFDSLQLLGCKIY